MRTRKRRGMLLLVVLALLSLFAMMAVAFVVMAGAARDSAKKISLMEVQRDPPDKLVNLAANVVVRGPAISASQANNTNFFPSCAIGPWNLMEKIDSFDTIGTLNNQCTLSNIAPVCNGQLIEFALPPTNPGTDVYPANTPVDPFHCVGCVLTMLDGPAAGLSTRIVGINPILNQQTGTYNVQIAAFEGGVQPANGNHYIVNGFPYSGTGFGFSTQSGALNQMVTETFQTNGSKQTLGPLPLAFLPNAPPSAWGGTNGTIPGGVNSDYTAPDYQDPLTAVAAPDGSGGVFVPIPSMQRSDLIQYWINNNTQGIKQYSDFGKNSQNVFLLQQMSFRPVGAELKTSAGTVSQYSPNPYFTGSNLSYSATWDGVTPGQGQWDVDNMGRGRPDSVWVDLGMPVRYTADGKAYKPLFAILCLDMDGRLNLNAHGSLAQTIGDPGTPSGYYAPQNAEAYQSLNNGIYQADTGVYSAWGKANGQTAYAGPVGAGPTAKPPVTLPRGRGTGPAEVDLMPLFRNLSSPATFYSANYQYLLAGYNGTMGRYGPLSSGAPGSISALPGLSGTGSFLTINQAFPYSGDMNPVGGTYWTMSGVHLDAYGTPPDFQTMGAVGLDTAGRAINISMGGQVANGPYDIDLTRNAAHGVDVAAFDNPYSVSEFESIMRWTDRDAATLPRRLVNLTNNGNGSILNSRCAEFTVESYNVPVSPGALPFSLRQYLPNKRSVHPVDLIYAQFYKSGGSQKAAQSVMWQLLPWEVIQGLKMDINRPFGAGVYSLAGGGSLNPAYGPGQKILPDQPGMTNETLPQYTRGAPSPNTAAAKFNYSPDAGAFSKVAGTPVNDSLAARQLYARHLYVLMLSLVDTNAVLNNLKATNPAATNQDVARFCAQWAVNVVAYRDHNNIMVPFHYVVNPFTAQGWNPEQIDTTPAAAMSHTVWGCKRPELLITETLAFHDRRTEDRNDEVVDPKKAAADHLTYNRTKAGYTQNYPGFKPDANKDNLDPSFNSRFRPQGSAFVELFNPWPLMSPQTPDLAPQGGAGVDLAKTSGPNRTGSPVWRLVVVDPSKNPPSNGDELTDPDNPIVTSRPRIERVAYFVPLAGMVYPTTDDRGNTVVSYYPSTTNLPAGRNVVVAPGGYAVVGSGDPNTQNRTYIGFENGQTVGKPGTTRMVTLNPADVATDARVVKNANGRPVTANPPQVLGIDQAAPAGNGATSPQRFSVSEPTKGYLKYESAGPAAVTYSSATGQYSKVLDIPVDQQRDLLDNEGVWSKYLNVNGTFPAYRTIYLQRLADPTKPFVPESNGNPQLWNPYRTVDAMTVDLTCFDGLTAEKDPTTTTGAYHFESHQRGERNWATSVGATVSEMDLWKQEPFSKAPNWTGGGASPIAPNSNFALALNESLGYLNQRFGQPATNPAGDPQYPFPYLNWAYRPFNNVYELLLVPTVSSSRLFARNANNERGYYGYEDGAMRAAQPQPVYDGSNPTHVPYPHLLNFFDSKKSSSVGSSAQFHRLLYYVGVPSRFANTQIQVRADMAGQAPSTPAHEFHTPYNRISRYREPGLINLNTVTSPDVLFGAMNAYCSPLAVAGQLNPIFWDKFVRSRRGDPASGGPVTSSTPSPATTQQSLMNMFAQIDAKLPSRFMRPFRTPGGAYLTAPSEPARETDVTFLRGDPDQQVAERPLFEMDDYLMSSGTAPGNETPDKFPLACMDFNRSANFRYQLIEKLGSTVSTHSNVFAIWITVGYFEAVPAGNGVNAGNPDGYQLGQELGADTGDVTRHRAFFIFDRSLPVGFIRGQDINVERGFLLKRFIE